MNASLTKVLDSQGRKVQSRIFWRHAFYSAKRLFLSSAGIFGFSTRSSVVEELLRSFSKEKELFSAWHEKCLDHLEKSDFVHAFDLMIQINYLFWIIDRNCFWKKERSERPSHFVSVEFAPPNSYIDLYPGRPFLEMLNDSESGSLLPRHFLLDDDDEVVIDQVVLSLVEKMLK